MNAMKMDVSGLIGEIKTKQAISAADVMTLRKEIWPDGNISCDEADVLFQINDLGSDPSEEWLESTMTARLSPQRSSNCSSAQWKKPLARRRFCRTMF